MQGVTGSIPGQGIKIPHATWLSVYFLSFLNLLVLLEFTAPSWDSFPDGWPPAPILPDWATPGQLRVPEPEKPLSQEHLQPCP